MGGQEKQLFRRRIAKGQATDRGLASVDHDIATERGNPLGLALFPVQGVGIVDPERDMVAAIGIQASDAVEPLGHLPVALAPFGTGAAAGAEDFERVKPMPAASLGGGLDFEPPFRLQADEQQPFRWERKAGQTAPFPPKWFATRGELGDPLLDRMAAGGNHRWRIRWIGARARVGV